MVGPAEVQVFPNHLVEEDPARHGAVQYLRQTELGLEDRELIAVTGPAVTDGKRVRQARQPLAPQGLDPRGREPVAQRLVFVWTALLDSDQLKGYSPFAAAGPWLCATPYREAIKPLPTWWHT